MGDGGGFIAPIIAVAAVITFQPEIMALAAEAGSALTGEAMIASESGVFLAEGAAEAAAYGIAPTMAVAPTIAAQGITGALAGGLGALATGGDIGQGLLRGGLGGAASGALGAATGDWTQGMSDTAKALTKGATRFAGTTASGVLTGQPIGKAALGGAVSAGTGALFDQMLQGSPATSVGEKLARGAGQAFTETGIMNLLRAPTGERVSETTPSGAGGVGPGSTALGQAVQVSPDMGYAPGGPVLGAGEQEKARRPVWNIKSLRTAQADQTDTAQES